MYDFHITYENYKTYILKTFTPETKSFSVKGEHEGKCEYTSNWLNSQFMSGGGGDDNDGGRNS